MTDSDSRSPRGERRSPKDLLTARVHSVWRKTKLFLRLTAPIALLLSNVTSFGERYYSTDIGDQLTLEFEGAKVTLNTNSRIDVHDSKSCLGIRIFQGEVLFEVARVAARCVEVWAGNALVSDLGTKFDVVYLTEDKVTVTVIEGAVELAKVDADTSAALDELTGSIRLRQGERGEVLPHATARRPTSQRLEMSRILSDISWERGDLIFDSNSLQEIVQQFNRYNRRPQIEIPDAALASRKMSGVFRSHDPESFIADLQQVDSRIRVIRPGTADGNLILSIHR